MTEREETHFMVAKGRLDFEPLLTSLYYIKHKEKMSVY